MATRTTAAPALSSPGATRGEDGTPSGRAAGPHDGYRHEAFLWKGEGEFLAGTVPFILNGLVAGQPVMVAVIQQRIDLLKTALGADAAAAVLFVDMAQIGRNPARIIPAWRSFLGEHGAGGRPVRGIGEPVWAGRRPAEVTECQIHEALLNLAVEPHVPLWLLCPYDVEALAPDVVTEAHRSHPALVDVDSHRPSTLYGGSHHVGTVFASELPPVGSVTLRRELCVGDLVSVRQDVLDHAVAAGVPDGRTADLALAVHEVAANSLEHAGGAGLLRIWQDEEALVCEIRDVGRIQDPLVGRTLPAWDDEGGRGLWLANHLCDLVQVRSGRSGTTVRILTWLQPVPGRARSALAGGQDRRRP
jgi:anti-sigma regulatory factor (Ser/Thr protein kinase)